MKVLIVGAGTIGQVYGYHLQQGGADVTFYVRPKYRETVAKGFALYPLNRNRHLDHPVRFKGFGVISGDEEAAALKWDYVILCTHGGAIETPWFEPFARAIGQAVFVNLHSSAESRARLEKLFAPERLLQGMITLIANQAPLPGETAEEPGVAYWFPPLSKVPFQGDARVAQRLLDAFRRGGFPCRYDGPIGDTAGGIVADTVLSTFVLTLETVGWKLKSFLAPEPSALAKAAMLETLEIQFRVRGLGRPVPAGVRRLLGRTFFRVFVGLCRLVMPFDLETSLRVHFTKIREQGRAGLSDNLRHARELGIAAPALERLAAQLAPGEGARGDLPRARLREAPSAPL